VTILSTYTVGVTVIGTSALTPVVNKGTNSFTVTLYNSAGTATAGTVDIQLRGY
jgi:hypothetical protein